MQKRRPRRRQYIAERIQTRLIPSRVQIDHDCCRHRRQHAVSLTDAASALGVKSFVHVLGRIGNLPFSRRNPYRQRGTMYGLPPHPYSAAHSDIARLRLATLQRDDGDPSHWQPHQRPLAYFGATVDLLMVVKTDSQKPIQRASGSVALHLPGVTGHLIEAGIYIDSPSEIAKICPA
jgi:hypothetical protein